MVLDLTLALCDLDKPTPAFFKNEALQNDPEGASREIALYVLSEAGSSRAVRLMKDLLRAPGRIDIRDV